jgi:alanyl-tRNA synthetase
MDAPSLRRVFTQFFTDRGHTVVPSAGLIPHHPRAPLFTNAGMNQFLPVFLGEEPPSYPRATSVQKCVRIMGKHDDIDNIGISRRHVTFFEMFGNFSFGDYFKADAIPFAWQLVTEGFGLEPDRLWVTVHHSDDEAADIWRDGVGLPAERIQRLGEDNFWEMGETGPCGPCSEIFYDKGDAYGPAGGPGEGGGDERYVEFWNLVFMQYDRQADGTLLDLPRKNIDTGLGFERTLGILQKADSVFDTDILRPLVEAAARTTGRPYGEEERVDVALRILADHARTMSFLVSDGVYPSNEGRGYVLRRIIRRAVRQAFQLGVETPVTPPMVRATVEVMGDAYPDLARNADFVADIVDREEAKFRQTLRLGLAALDTALEDASQVPGAVAFRLHDTYGFPIELTREIAAERQATVDDAGFRSAMDEQRRRARADRSATTVDGEGRDYRELLDQFGTTDFTGYGEYQTAARVLAVLPGDDGTVEVFLDRTPFYAESGGQVGDSGLIVTEQGRAQVLDTTAPLPGLHRHTARILEGALEPGQEAMAAIDALRRDAIRRNHTGTHLLHWALREVLGTHVKQQGSLVAPEHLRFDFSNFGPVEQVHLDRVEELVNEHILSNEPVRAYETSKAHAEQLGAVAFFGDKYGDYVRVVEAGSRSLELCGGTHVGALGMIGPVKVTSESSIGSNLRRITALTGTSTLERARTDVRLLARVAELLRAEPREAPEAVERVLARQRELEQELRALRAQAAAGEAARLAAGAEGGAVVARRDGVAPDQLRELALTIRKEPGVKVVALIGSPDGARVALVAAVTPDAGIDAAELLSGPARLVGGGGGGKGEVAMAGGKDVTKIDDALAALRSAVASR